MTGLGLLLLALGLLVGCSCIPHHPIQSAMVLADVVAGPEPSRLKRITPEPVRAGLQFQSGGKDYRADVYLPAKPPQAGLMLVPGAAEEGKDDPRLVAFARTLARVRFAVIVPDFPQIRRFELGTSNIYDLGAVVQYLAGRPDLAPHGRLGIAGMSYAVGPAILAALEPGVREKVSFIVGVGAYYDLGQVVTFFTTGWFRDITRPHSPCQYLEPNAYGKWVFVLSNVERLKDPNDRKLMGAIARLKMENPGAPVDALVGELGPEGRAYYALLTNRDPHRVPELLQGLPADIRREFHALNVAEYDLSRLRARLLLFHGRDDDIIPYTESLALARAVRKHQAHTYLIHGLAHVDFKAIGFRDKLQLWRGVGDLLHQRSAPPP